MAERHQTIKECDMCKKEITFTEDSKLDIEEKIKRVRLPVLFLTEQTEGRSTTPYVTHETIDMCEDCLGRAITIHAIGAQGYNQYWFKGDK